MNRNPLSRSAFISLSILAVGGLVLPAALAPRTAEAARRAPTRFFDGVSDEASGAAPVWFATTGKDVDGTLGGLGGLDESGDGGRINGTVKQGKISAKVFNVRNRKVGSFGGNFVEAVPTGTYRLGQQPVATWTAQPVTADAAAISSVGGKYLAEGLGSSAEVIVNFSSGNRSFSVTGNARIGAGRINIIKASGKWIADANGNLWLLGTKFKYNRVPGAPSLPIPLPRDGAVAKLGYTQEGNRLILTDAEDGSSLVTLRRD